MAVKKAKVKQVKVAKNMGCFVCCGSSKPKAKSSCCSKKTISKDKGYW
jgi:hypothetical protein